MTQQFFFSGEPLREKNASVHRYAYLSKDFITIAPNSEETN